MNEKEFRIGNYFKPTDGSNLDFTEVTTADLRAWESGAIYGKKIPLTKDWLLELGFSQQDKTWKDGSISENLYVNGIFFIGLHENYYTISKFHNQYEQIFINNIDYVHQLQNLYFALTGKELLWKLI